MIVERAYIMYGERLPFGSFLHVYVTRRADQVLYGRYSLDIYSNDVGLCIIICARSHSWQ